MDAAEIFRIGCGGAHRAVDSAMAGTYWRLDKRIVEEEPWGKVHAGQVGEQWVAHKY
jgi:hypothetical protein